MLEWITFESNFTKHSSYESTWKVSKVFSISKGAFSRRGPRFCSRGKTLWNKVSYCFLGKIISEYIYPALFSRCARLYRWRIAYNNETLLRFTQDDKPSDHKAIQKLLSLSFGVLQRKLWIFHTRCILSAFLYKMLNELCVLLFALRTLPNEWPNCLLLADREITLWKTTAFLKTGRKKCVLFWLLYILTIWNEINWYSYNFCNYVYFFCRYFIMFEFPHFCMSISNSQ